VIIGFRKEQVNANLLNGKGEIRDVTLNCSLFNESIARVCPYIRMEEIHVSRIGFHVTSWTNLRKAPIIVDIGHVTAKIQEPLILLPLDQRQRIQVITESELIQKLAEGFKPFRGSGSYGLVDRIVDNLTIEIESFRLEFQTWGKFKTTRLGPWTPPLLRVEMKNLKICSVDAESSEGNPDQVWAHNQGRRDTFLTYKKMLGECQIKLVPQFQSCDQNDHGDLNQELSKFIMEIQIAVERRLRDGAVLACQLDVTIPEVDVDIDSTNIRLLAHFASGVQYCLAKDRSFKDPLRSLAESAIARLSSSSPSVVDIATARGDSIEALDVTEDDDGIDKDNTGAAQRNFDRSSIQDDGSVTCLHSDNGITKDEDPSVTNDSFTRNSRAKRPSRNRSKSERSVIILPNDLIIYKSISLTCSINKLMVWGSYPGDEEKGCLEFVAKGCIAEAIWPKVNMEHGLYVQVSTSFASLEERVGHHKRTLLLAGMQRDDHLSHHLPSRKPQEINADEFFPLFERRSIRDDPLDLRHLFPTQAFGLKTTIDVLDQSKYDGIHDRFVVLHEMGGDEIEIILDTDVFVRITRFIINMDGEGFDPRWDTGDWSDLLTPDMLHHPSETLHLYECLQECTQLFLDENLMISSDLFNVTARFSNVAMRIPSAVQDSLRSSDIILKWKETTFVVSSDLPRTFLTGRIGNSISGDARQDNEKGIIDFPNDPSDLCYRCEQGLTGNAISTFRLQLTTRGFEVNIVPIIPFCMATQSQNVITIGDSTAIFCFEGDPPTVGCNKMEITVFLSILIQQLLLNIDFDILAGATLTLLSHKKHIVAIMEMMSNIFAQSQDGEATSSQKNATQSLEDTRIKQSLKGRRILASRHMSQSRETGGLAIIFCVQQKDFRLRVWRQNVPIRSPLRDKLEPSHTFKYQDDEGMIDLVNLLDFEMKDLEVGIEFDFHSNSDHRTVIKSYLSRANLRVVDLAKEIEEHISVHRGSSAKSTGKDKTNVQSNLTNLCSFGNESMPCGLDPSGLAQHFAFRLEAHHKNNAQSWSMAADVSAPSTINLDADAVKASIVLIIEALLLPAWSNDLITANKAFLFPPGTIGAMFYLVAKEMFGKQDFALKTVDSLETDTNTNDPILERVLRSICKTFLPHNLQVILLRCEIANLLISIPSENKDEKKQNKNVSFLLNQADIITRFYPVPGSPLSEIEQVLACKGTDWSSLINTNKEGFYQYICSRQSLLSMIEENDETKLEMVVHPFEISFTYSGAEVDISMEKGILIDDVRLIEKIQSRLKSAVRLSSECLSEIYSIVGAMMYRDVTEDVLEIATEGMKSSKETRQKRDFSSIFKTRKLLRKANEEFRRYENSARDNMLKRDNELDALKIDLFKKERERFGALSLMASRVAGWIRMGGQHRSGQRVVKKSLLWPFWAILRKELLILYPRPGESKPSDIVSLVNARIRNLAGGNSKQDTKRGFAIVESSGMIRYFVTGSAQEYELWTNEINCTIRLFSDSTELSDSEGSVDMDTSEFMVNGMDNENDGTAGVSRRTNKIGNRLSSAFQSARLKGKEISDRRQSELTIGQSIHDDDSSTFANDVKINSEMNDARRNTLTQDSPTSKRTEISKKFSEVGLVRKSRLGSAIQNARYKRDEITNRRKIHDDLQISSAKIVDLQGSLANSSVDLNTTNGILPDEDVDGNRGSFGPRTGFGNKLGSAIQNARTKAKESIVKQGRLRGSEQQADHPPNDNTMNNDPTQGSSSHGSINNAMNPLRSATDSIQSSIRSKDPARQEENNRRNSRFSFLNRREDSQDDSLFGGDLLTLKNIYVGQDITSLPNASHVEVIPLKILKENWFVKVSELTNTAEPAGMGITHHQTKSTNVLDDLDEKTSSPKTTIEAYENKEECVSVASSILDVESDQIKSKKHIAEIQNSGGEMCSVAGDQRDVKEQTEYSKASTDQAIRDIERINRYSLSESQEDIPRFVVKVLPVQHTQNVGSFEKQLSFGDVLKLYSGVSEMIEDILRQQFGKYSSVCDGSSALPSEEFSTTASFEKVMVCGRVLGGILEARESFECIEGFRRYQCESIENFFNALLKCPLPGDALMFLSDILGINELMEDFRPIKDESRGRSEINSHTVSLVDDCTEINGLREGVIENHELCSSPSGNRPGNVLNLLSACETELQWVETRNAATEGSQRGEIAKNTKVSPSIQIQRICYEPLLPPTLTERIHNSIHKSLTDAMAQRDEAHAQLVGANVMHTNSLERMRKKNERLEIDAKLSHEIARVQLQEDLQTLTIASIFGKPDEKVKRIQKEIDRKIEKVHQILRNDDGDAEMVELCNQLASEISTKTSLTLQIESLKQTRETERKTEVFEKEALKDEMRRLQDLLEVERQKKSEACTEAANWKALYEECQANDDNT
jgi:hypothetical protein